MSNKLTKSIDKKTLDIFVKLTRKKAREEITRREKRLDRSLTKEEKKLIAKRVARRTRGRVALIGMFALGSFSGVKATNLLNEGNSKGITQNKSEISIDAEEVNKDININNVQSDREIFVNGIKVELNEITTSEDLRGKIENEIDKLQTPEDVLKYIKGIYADEYNEKNNTNINANNISFDKTQLNVLYSDKAQNGDQIVRSCSESEYGGIGIPVQTNYGIIKAFVQNGESTEIEKVTNYEGNGTYVLVYSKDEKVEQSDETALTQLGGVIDNGIDYYTALKHKEENSYQAMLIYKQRLIDSVVEYKQSEIDESKKEHSSYEIENQSNEQFEIED